MCFISFKVKNLQSLYLIQLGSYPAHRQECLQVC